MHITASVFINDDEPGLHEDYKEWLEGLAPFDPSPQRYKHHRTGEDNADPHMKRQVMGGRSSLRSRMEAGLRTLRADLPRRIRQAESQTCAGRGHR